MAWRLGAIISEYPFKDLSLYEPRWVWPPSFRQTEQYRQLLQSIKQSGIFQPLLILPDGRAVDGQHRYACAKELGLDSVPVRIIDVALPLTDADHLAIEDWMVYDTITRRHLTKAQATGMLYDLLRGRTEAQAKSARLANLKRGREKRDVEPDSSRLTVKELATRAGKSQRSVERAVTVMRHAPPEIQAQLRSGKLTLGAAERAMKASTAACNRDGQTATAVAETSSAVPAATVSLVATSTDASEALNERAQSPTLPAPSPDERSKRPSIAENFVDAARGLVRRARVWNREALEQLVHALRQIEASLRDAGAKALEDTPR